MAAMAKCCAGRSESPSLFDCQEVSPIFRSEGIMTGIATVLLVVSIVCMLVQLYIKLVGFVNPHTTWQAPVAATVAGLLEDIPQLALLGIYYPFGAPRAPLGTPWEAALCIHDSSQRFGALCRHSDTPWEYDAFSEGQSPTMYFTKLGILALTLSGGIFKFQVLVLRTVGCCSRLAASCCLLLCPFFFFGFFLLLQFLAAHDHLWNTHRPSSPDDVGTEFYTPTVMMGIVAALVPLFVFLRLLKYWLCCCPQPGDESVTPRPTSNSGASQSVNQGARRVNIQLAAV